MSTQGDQVIVVCCEDPLEEPCDPIFLDFPLIELTPFSPIVAFPWICVGDISQHAGKDSPAVKEGSFV